MAFDFPDSPAVGDEYILNGAKYTWTGLVWDLSGADAALDYVQTTGDTMTGPLNINTPGADGASLCIRSELGVRTISLNPSGPPHSGLIEFWDPAKPDTRKAYIGYGAGTSVADYYININPEGGKVHINGAGLAMQDNAGIHWGNTSAKTSHTDLSEGICLYGWGTTSKFGFNITSGTLGYCVENVGNRHCFTVGGTERFIINKDGAYNVTGHFRTGEVDGLGIRMYGSAYIYKKIGTGMVMRRSANNVQWQTEMNDGSGTTPVATASMTTFKDMGLALPELKSDAELKPFARKDEGIEGFDVAKLITLMLKKIRALEAKCAQLEKRK